MKASYDISCLGSSWSICLRFGLGEEEIAAILWWNMLMMPLIYSFSNFSQHLCWILLKLSPSYLFSHCCMSLESEQLALPLEALSAASLDKFSLRNSTFRPFLLAWVPARSMKLKLLLELPNMIHTCETWWERMLLVVKGCTLLCCSQGIFVGEKELG